MTIDGKDTAVFETLKEILVSKLKVAPENITPDATREDAELDSLAIVELAMVLSTEFGLGISDDELLETTTIGGIADLMAQRSMAS
ncbi:phosphopantetheine-binding [Parafrankia sp. EAN1pec]|uniref:acyl carrier protein n=1 Tax=Parafrankia sp. (strain EAN1pec) TaxID=298653 RepID=UPI0000542BA1|nr:phosphopantetheine-binding [Frankia sp. EAN1pec]